MRESKRFILLAGLLALALVAAACGEDEPAIEEDGGEVAGDVTVELTEFEVSATPDQAAAGDVSFALNNTGGIDHEFVVIATDEAPEDLPVSGNQVDEPAVDVVGEIEPFSAGTSESLTANLDAGSYVLICNVPDHYESGMRTGFTVE